MNEARLVAGMADKRRRTQYELYAYCSDYFWDNYRGVFFAEENAAAEILQNTFIAFWENIERKKIYVEDGIVMGKDNKPLNGSILTYFMSIPPKTRSRVSISQSSAVGGTKPYSARYRKTGAVA